VRFHSLLFGMMRTVKNLAPPTVDYAVLSSQIQGWAEALGFQEIGIADTNLDDAERGLLQWLAQGFHGSMNYMAKHGTKRTRPDGLVSGTVRVISVRMNYLASDAADSWQALADGERAFISRYALGRDYHKVLRQRLAQLAAKIKAHISAFDGRVFTDSAPVMEVALAEKAALGWRGKHTLLLNREHGSWFFLGEIYINLPLPVTAASKPENHCGTCTRCIDICPTQAIIAPYQLDARRCISYLTIELQGSIPLEFRKAIGNRIYGCDDCQLVCPWNRFAQVSLEPDFAVRHGLDKVSLVECFGWDELLFAQKFAGSAIYRIGHKQWLRNVALALGNAQRSDEVVNALKSRAQHESEIVREQVAWALAQHEVF
jgi:epoxyqueuosine reductase